MTDNVKVIDNREFILKNIRDYADGEISQLNNECEDQIRVISENQTTKNDLEVETLSKKLAKQLDDLENQLVSNFELDDKKRILEKQKELYDNIIDKVKDHIEGLPVINKTMFFQKIANKMLESNSDIKEFITPKGIKIPKLKCKDEYDTLKITGVINDNEIVELSLGDLLLEKEALVYKIISETFF